MKQALVFPILLLPKKPNTRIPCPEVADQYDLPVHIRLCDIPDGFREQIVGNGACIDSDGKCVLRKHYPDAVDAMNIAFAEENGNRRVYAC